MTTRARRTVALSLLGILLAGGALILLWPSPVDRMLRSGLDGILNRLRGAGLGDLFRYGVVEFAGNILLFIPLGIVLALLLPRGRRWIAPILCLVGSLAAEFAQATFLPNRQADPTDVLANAIGGLIGTVLVVLLLHGRERAAGRASRGRDTLAPGVPRPAEGHELPDRRNDS